MNGTPAVRLTTVEAEAERITRLGGTPSDAVLFFATARTWRMAFRLL